MAGQRQQPTVHGAASIVEGRPQLYEHQGLYQLVTDAKPKSHAFPAAQRPRVASAHRDHIQRHAVSENMHRQTWRPSSAPLVHSVYNPQQQHPMHEGTKNLLKVNSLHLETITDEQNSQILSANPARRARPKSACVTAAAWKAYGSPKLRGFTKEAPPPAPIHPQARSKGPEAALSRAPAVGILGGGYRYPCAHIPTVGPTVKTAGNAEHSSHPQPRVPGDNRHHPWQTIMMDVHSEANSNTNTDEYRFTHTQPTDPGSQRMLLKMLTEHPTSEIASSRLRRPQSAHMSVTSHTGRTNSVQTGSSSSSTSYNSRGRPVSAMTGQRLKSTSVGMAHKQGCKFVPTTVCGHLSPEREYVVPPPDDNSWMYCRMGPTALSRLVAGCKMPLQPTDDTPIMSRTVENLPMSITTQARPTIPSPAKHSETTAQGWPDKTDGENTYSLVGSATGSLLTRQAAVLQQLMAELNTADPLEPGLTEEDVVHDIGDQLEPPQLVAGVDEQHAMMQSSTASGQMPNLAISRRNSSDSCLSDRIPSINGDGSHDVEGTEYTDAVDCNNTLATTRPTSASQLRPGSARPRYSGGTAAGSSYPAAPDMYAIEEHSGEDEDVLVEV